MRRKSTNRTGWLAMGLMVAAAVTAHAAEPPFTGVVTGDNVYVRSGPARSYYYLAKLNTGDLVEVVEAVPGWYAVQPVKGVDHLVAKRYVELAEDGRTGAVTGDRVNFRALNPTPRPDGTTFLQHHYRYSKTKLESGDSVVVTGSLEDFYRIVPPKGAKHYISAQFVAKATDAQIAAARRKQAEQERGAVEGAADLTVDAAEVVVDTTVAVAEGAADLTVDAAGAAVSVVEGAGETETAADTTQPAETDTTTTITITEGDVAVATEVEVAPTTQPAEVAAVAEAVEAVEAVKIDTTAPADQQLAELETVFSDESAKPITDQNVAGLLAAYEALGKREGLTDDQERVIATRMELLGSRAALKRTIAQLTETRTQVEQQQREAGEPTKDYAAVGKLLASTVYTGGRLPLLYRLADPLSGLTIGYVAPGAHRGLARYLGKVVGIVGDSAYDQGLRLKIITVEEIDALTAGR